MDLLKNLDNMITAEDFFNQYGGYTREEMLIRAREFAKLHVKEIQKLQKSKYYAGESGYIKEEEFIEILNDIK